ncbi:MAG TPA: ABC transporter substrate-binding protein [Stellaceae bacterium]|nr:ABC transporter substrate-binding protein [Stellaceae bacterium]
MTSPTRRAGAGRIMALCLALIGATSGARAVPASPQDSVRNFYDVLLTTMKHGRMLGQSGRYATLAPVVNGVFDVPFMARLAVGPSWLSLTATQQQQIVTAFGRYVSATYADRFDSYSGQQLQVTGSEPTTGGVIVETRIVETGNEPVTISYLMRRNDDGVWQIADVYLDGTISQLATQRSEFHSILVRQGVDGLITALNRKVDLLTSDAGKSP